ncbi:hypothetical protein BA062_37825 [Prauserella flavalba]|uniref:Uncharacterized protein n=1 Tax=Prauserella flavalba TaxID=1477506 RepID=A0A318L8T0_9PSEU|nr:hypothetical protein BA062_37825 [Prauserella flavalba]
MDCPECADGGCEICLPATLTPRTAAMLGHALAVLADEAYDYVYRTGMCRDGAPGPLGAVLACVADQDEWFLRRYARAFDDLSSDLQVGRHPTPACFSGKRRVAALRVVQRRTSQGLCRVRLRPDAKTARDGPPRVGWRL